VTLAWDRFEELAGGPERNFELLWRGVVQRTWGRYGTLRSVRQQPGVEFHLRIEIDCDLGDRGRWFGWQCRWYELRQDNTFRADQRRSIEKSIRKTITHLPDLTDYVLCLKQRPSASDVAWYFALTPAAVGTDAPRLPRLHLWDMEDLEPFLVGSAAVFRETYFGDLVVTEAQLEESRARCLAPVRDRWMPDLNIATHVELDLRTALLRPGSLDFLEERADFLTALHADIGDDDDDDLPVGAQADLAAVRAALAQLAGQLRDLVRAVDDADPSTARDLLVGDYRPDVTPIRIRRLARLLRGRRHPAALPISAAESALRQSRAMIGRARALADAPLVAVVGDPGQGKSHLAAELTAPSDGAWAGVFMTGRDLRHRGTLDELAARLPGLSVDGFDDLLEALDAAGARAGQRIPVVIDGLNESERPHEWHVLLGTLEPVLSRFTNVLVVVTLRGAVAEEVLIPQAHTLYLRWESQEAWKAVRRYFEHYKIDPGSSRLPMWLLSDPLFLRLFCEAVNGERENWVGAEGIPDDLVAVYELFRERTVRRLARQLDLRPEFVVRKLDEVANALWDRGARDLPFEDVQAIVDEPETEWRNSLVRALEEEGIFSRNPGDSWEDQRTTVLFDRFAGYLIADALLRGRSPIAGAEFLGSSVTWDVLAGDPQARHPLASDIVQALVGDVPRHLHGRQLWHFAPSQLGDGVLKATLGLSSDYIDAATQTALAEYVAQRSPRPNSVHAHALDHLWDYHDSPRHKLNAEFLDRALRLMPVASRDAVWSEWTRRRTERIGRSLDAATNHWTMTEVRGPNSDLAARAFAWLTTTTDRRLRDRASLALQRYGRADPRRVFELAVEFGDVDDPYTTDRTLAACVGAALAHQMPDPAGGFRSALGTLIEILLKRYTGSEATHPTSHVLIRDHVRTLVAFAGALHPEALPEALDATTISFAAGPAPVPVEADADAGEELARVLQMDFENYTVGMLFEDRANYDHEHRDWQRALAEIRGRIWELGWRSDLFGQIDDAIAEESWRQGRADRKDRTDRYGKKYSWIAYHELAGRLSDAGRVKRREWWRLEVSHEIDPTFPADPPQLTLDLPKWASQAPDDDRDWYESGPVEVPEELLCAATLDGAAGPWVLVAGHLSHRDSQRGREVWAHVRSMLVNREDSDGVTSMLEGREYLGNHFLPDPPEDAQTYAGEMPWSDSFMAHGDLGWGDPPYEARLGGHHDQEKQYAVEIVAHEYASHEGALVLPAYGCCVPSARLARGVGLRQSPGRLDLVGLDGRSASRTLLAPDDFVGDLLYIREDVLAAYAAGRPLVQVVWGERRVRFERHGHPPWLRDVGPHADLWRCIALRELSEGGAPDGLNRPGEVGGLIS